MKIFRELRLSALIVVGSTAYAALAQDGTTFPPPPRDWPSPVADKQSFTMLLLDRLEYRLGDGPNLSVWDAQGWAGGDMNRLWVKTEGEKEVGGRTERAEVQALYARRISPFWHLQAGVRRDARSGIYRNSAVIGVQGLAPYWFSVEAMLFGERRGVSGRLEVETDLVVAQRLILQPRLETQFAGYTDTARGVGRGVEHVEAGLRLRYEFRRELAPYVGVTWTRKVGQTADLARVHGESVRASSVVLGIRAWY